MNATFVECGHCGVLDLAGEVDLKNGGIGIACAHCGERDDLSDACECRMCGDVVRELAAGTDDCPRCDALPEELQEYLLEWSHETVQEVLAEIAAIDEANKLRHAA